MRSQNECQRWVKIQRRWWVNFQRRLTKPGGCPTIRLRDHEIEQVRTLAAQRNGCKSSASNKRVTTTSTDLGIHALGLAAEIAVGRYLNCPVDRRIHRHGDRGVDLVWRGLDLQVKLNQTPSGDLYVSSMKGLLCDAMILVLGRDATGPLRLAGWLPVAEFRHFARQKRYRECYPEVWAVPQSCLRPMRELWQYVGEVQ